MPVRNYALAFVNLSFVIANHAQASVNISLAIVNLAFVIVEYTQAIATAQKEIVDKDEGIFC